MIKYNSKYSSDFKEIIALYASVGWTNYTNHPEMLRAAIEHSLDTIWAYDEEKLIGLIRVVGDGHSIIFIQDIIVSPAYQRLGIGSNLLGMMIDKYQNVYQMHLMTDNTPKTKQFYRSMGFQDVNELDCLSYTYVWR